MGMSDQEHWMDRLWREKGRKVSWLIIPAIFGASTFFLYMLSVTYKHSHPAIIYAGLFCFMIVGAGIGHLIDNQKDD